MKRKNLFGPAVLALVLAGGAISGCVSTDDGQGVAAIESMSDLEFSKWKVYVSLGVKIGANRLLDEGQVTEEELNTAADVLETVRDQPLFPGATSIIMPALKDAGLTNDEVELLLFIVEQELLSRGALDWVGEDGLVALSPRTKELLTAVASALRAADVVTASEAQYAETLNNQYGNL